MLITREMDYAIRAVRALADGEKHNITALGEYDFKRRYLKLTTESAKGVR